MKSGKTLFALTGLACVSFSAMAMAEQAPYATYDIRLENTAVQTKEPVMTTPVSKNTVSFHIENNTGKAVYFVKGTEKEYIPVVSNNTVTAPYSKEPYKVVDGEGKTVASWRLAPNDTQKANATSVSKEKLSRWSEQLQQVLDSSRNRTVSYEYKTEPVTQYSSKHTNQTTTKKNTIIRGYW